MDCHSLERRGGVIIPISVGILGGEGLVIVSVAALLLELCIVFVVTFASNCIVILDFKAVFFDCILRSKSIPWLSMQGTVHYQTVSLSSCCSRMRPRPLQLMWSRCVSDDTYHILGPAISDLQQ